jgi:hypothetical protein
MNGFFTASGEQEGDFDFCSPPLQKATEPRSGFEFAGVSDPG